MAPLSPHSRLGSTGINTLQAMLQQMPDDDVAWSKTPERDHSPCPR